MGIACPVSSSSSLQYRALSLSLIEYLPYPPEPVVPKNSVLMRVDYFVLVATALIGRIGSVAAYRQWTVDPGSCASGRLHGPWHFHWMNANGAILKAKGQFIQGGMDGAFHMVDMTIQGLENNNEAVQNVTGWLFGTTNIDGVPPRQKLLRRLCPVRRPIVSC